VEELIKVAVQQGLGYGLFVCLLFYVLKEQAKRDAKSEEREKNYQNVITELTKNFEIVNVISCKIDKVEDKIEEVLRK
jgi:hypothetical protein